MASPALAGVVKRRRERKRVPRVAPPRPVALAAVGDDEALPAREMPYFGKGSRARATGAWYWNRGQIGNYRKARAHAPHLSERAFARRYHEIVGRTESSLRNGRQNNLVVADGTPPARAEDLAAERLLDGLIRAASDIPNPNAIRGWLCIERMLEESKIPPIDALVDAWIGSRLVGADVVLKGEVRKWLADRLEGDSESSSESSISSSESSSGSGYSTSGFSTSSSESEESPTAAAKASSAADELAIADLVDERVGSMFEVPDGARGGPEYDAGPPAPPSTPRRGRRDEAEPAAPDRCDSGPTAPTEDERDWLEEVEVRVKFLEGRHHAMRVTADKAGNKIAAVANRATALETGLAAVARAVNDLGSRIEEIVGARVREAIRDGSTDGTLYLAVAEVVGQMMDECKVRASARDALADRD